jgi:hypothetical protein
MNVPIRMIGVATAIFWIFMILFGVSAIYSVKDMRFSFGEPQISMTSKNKLLLSEPITIANTGYYRISDFNATSEIFDEQGSYVASGSTFIQDIMKNANVSTYHNVTFDINDVLQQSGSLLFNDSEFRDAETVTMRVAEVIPVQASANLSLSWGAPLYDFKLGTPQYSEYNMTWLKVEVPVSFENHAFFDLDGTVQTRLFSSAGAVSGEGQANISALQHSSFYGALELYIQPSAVSTSGYFEVSFITSFFSYGPLVIRYG